MKLHLACALAIAAVLPLAACGGDGDPQSPPAPSLDDIRQLTGLSAPVEAAAAQQERQQDIVSRADSLVVSTTHVEAVLPDATHTFRLVSECSGPQCELLDPTTGETETASLGTAVVRLGAAEPIGSAHGITLMSETRRHMGVDATSLGAWMEHGSFALNSLRAVGEEAGSNRLQAMALGDLTGRPLTGSATWLGIMVGTPTAGVDQGDRLVGTATLNYDMSAGGLDAAFSGIENIDSGTAHTTETVIFSNLAIDTDGTFSTGQSGTRIQGGFYGPDHVEAAGIFEQSDIVGAFGARRQ
ncbi:MAG: hypothetical protein OXI15_14850 [Chromatiales bacterium]|nr:hypothetical protein [Chromatiales bacterium]